MKTIKDKAIKKIEEQFEEISNSVLSQMDILSDIFSDGFNFPDEETIVLLGEQEEHIDFLENKIKENIIKTIALYQPVAGDIRKVFAVYDMISDLERIANYVIKISELCSVVTNRRQLEESSVTIHKIIMIVFKMLRHALLSFFNDDKSYAKWTIKKDKFVDELYHKILKSFAESKDLNEKLQTSPTSWLDIGFILSQVARIGNQASSIAESSTYYLSGRNVKHENN